MDVYKLTNAAMKTFGGTQWTLGEWQVVTGDPAQPLGGPGWLHGYRDKMVAVFLNPIHADFRLPRLFKADVGKVARHSPRDEED